MLSINGYYDGREFVPLDNSLPKKNQKVIITILDEFMKPEGDKPFRKYVGKLAPESTREVMEALADCEQVDRDEW